MLRNIRWMFVIGLLFTALGCGSDTEGPNNQAGTNNVVPDAGTPDTNVPDEGANNPVPDSGTPDMGTEEDFGLFDFGNFDFGGDAELGPLTFDAVLPPRGPIAGGTPFIITGSGFTTQTAIFFGSRQAEVELVDGELVGQTPPGQGIGPVNVKGLDPTSGEFVLAGGYEYISGLAVDVVSPPSVPSTGGVEVTITGRGFDDDTRISFGGQSGLRHVLVSDTTLRVVTPPHPRGTVDVRASNRDLTATLGAGLVYFDPLSLQAIRPATAPTTGNVPVVLNGTGLEANMVVEFGGTPATVQAVTPDGTEATVVAPAHAAGLVDVRLQTATDAVFAEDVFFYSPNGNLEIAAVTPAQAPAVGGSKVTLIGAGLDAAGLTVEVDGIPATVVEQGSGHAVIQVPAHVPGLVDIYAYAGAQNDTFSGFEYVPNLWIDTVTPNTDTTAGGATITLAGEGFSNASRVMFGLVPATFTVVDDQTITVTAPAQSAGLVDITVERGDIDATFKNGFTFTEPLAVYSLTPVRGSIAGNTQVVLLGRGFVGDIEVTFDGLSATDVQIWDAQTLAVRTPPHPAGAAAVKVKRAQEIVDAPSVYTYFNPGARLGGAWGGPIQGAVNVSVYEMGGSRIENAFVMLSTNAATPYQGFTDANGLVTLSGPDVYGVQTVTAVAAGYSSASIQNVNAENITLFLSKPPEPSSGNQPPPPMAYFNGRITGLDKLAEPGPTQFQMAIVQTTQADPFSQNPDPGFGNVVYSDGDYTLNSRVGDLALVAVGGLFDNATSVFTPLRMGVARYIVAADQQVQTVDIDLDIPLETTITFKLDGVTLRPAGPDIHQVTPFLDFGFEGVFGMMSTAEGTADVIQARNQAPLVLDISDISYLMIGGATTSLAGVPFSTVFMRNVRNILPILQMPPLLGVPIITSPANGQVPTNRLVEFSTNSTNLPSFYYARIVDFQQTPIWDIFLPGDQTSFRLPDFPTFNGVPPEDQPFPYPPGTYILQIFAIREPGFTYANVSYGNLDISRWDAYAANVQLISF